MAFRDDLDAAQTQADALARGPGLTGVGARRGSQVERLVSAKEANAKQHKQEQTPTPKLPAGWASVIGTCCARPYSGRQLFAVGKHVGWHVFALFREDEALTALVAFGVLTEATLPDLQRAL